VNTSSLLVGFTLGRAIWPTISAQTPFPPALAPPSPFRNPPGPMSRLHAHALAALRVEPVDRRERCDADVGDYRSIRFLP